jgi:hypothetical protein
MGKKLLMLVLFFAVSLGLVLLPVGTASAQVEICDNKVDDDGDGLVDLEDPDCKKPPPNGVPCSPGFWKNHPVDFAGACGAAATLASTQGIVALDTCDELLAAVSCRGADATCLRSLAASLLNTVSGCVE